VWSLVVEQAGAAGWQWSRVAAAVAGVTAGVGALALVGITLNVAIPSSVLPGLPAMKPITGISFVLLAVALWFRRKGGSKGVPWVAPAAALLAAASAWAAAAASELGLVGAVFAGTPSELLGLLFVGLALAVLDVEAKGGHRPSEYFGFAAVLVGLLALGGYLYGGWARSGIPAYATMPLHSAALLVLLPLGVLASRPGGGVMATVMRQGSGGLVARHLLPAAVMVPLTMGWLRLLGERAGFYGLEFGLVLFALSNVVVFAGLVLGSARMVTALDEDVQRAHAELISAYDTTLEGWVRAVDLRDKETEGHSRRVVDMTERLARSMGLSDEQTVHIRRGALLHDIGKMGVPDAVLQKAGPLTDDEWKVMRRHPAYAFEWLSPIGFLRPALDIPYCHHEKWDGTGYPRGLRGEDIPLGARIFAIVDVWDALRSDRPYRPAWSEQEAFEYIGAQAGTHFDPNVVAAFAGLRQGAWR